MSADRCPRCSSDLSGVFIQYRTNTAAHQLDLECTPGMYHPWHDSQPETAMTDTPRPADQKAQVHPQPAPDEVERLRREAHDAFHAYSQSAPGDYSEAMFRATVAAIDSLADLAKRLERQATVWRIANDISLKERDEARRQLKDHRCTLPDSINEALNSGDGVYRP